MQKVSWFFKKIVRLSNLRKLSKINQIIIVDDLSDKNMTTVHSFFVRVMSKLLRIKHMILTLYIFS